MDSTLHVQANKIPDKPRLRIVRSSGRRVWHLFWSAVQLRLVQLPIHTKTTPYASWEFACNRQRLSVDGVCYIIVYTGDNVTWATQLYRRKTSIVSNTPLELVLVSKRRVAITSHFIGKYFTSFVRPPAYQ